MILRCCRWIPARTAEVKDESEKFEVGGKKVSELEVRGGIFDSGRPGIVVCTLCMKIWVFLTYMEFI